MIEKADTSVLRNHWRHFIWAWIFPVFVLIVLLLPSYAKHPVAIFATVVLPVLALCYHVAWKPVRSRQVAPTIGVFYVVLIPFLIWGAMLALIFGLASLAPGK